MIRRLAATLLAALALVLTGCNDDGADVRPPEGGSSSGSGSGSASTGG